MPTSSSSLLGLSHLYGEASELNQTKASWLAAEFELDKDFELPVSQEKIEKLLPAAASQIHLAYFKHREHLELPGLEFLSHKFEKSPHLRSHPLLSLAMHGKKEHRHEDPDQNIFITHPAAPRSSSLLVQVKDTQTTSDFLLALGIKKAPLSSQEIKFFQFFECDSQNVFIHHHPLFPKLSFHLGLVERSDCPAQPKMDCYGLRGISLLVQSLAQLKDRKLIAPQTFERDDRKFDLAFSNEGGLLIEFLSSKKQGELREA